MNETPDNPIENSLFVWDEWDGDQQCMTFYKCELLQDIGKYPKGTIIPTIHMLYIKSVMQFSLEGGTYEEFKIGLVVL